MFIAFAPSSRLKHPAQKPHDQLLPASRFARAEAAPLPAPELSRVESALKALDCALNQRQIPYFVIGSCARLAYMNKSPTKIPDLDVIVPDAQRLSLVLPLLKAIGQQHDLIIDTSLSRVFRCQDEAYCLVYGPLSYRVEPEVMRTRRVRLGNAEFWTLPPETLLHTFGLVAEPLRAKDRANAYQFARFLKGRREFDRRKLEPFHLFWNAHWKYFPLKPVQYRWRQFIKTLPPNVRRTLLRKIYTTGPIRIVRAQLTFWETRICTAPRHNRQVP